MTLGVGGVIQPQNSAYLIVSIMEMWFADNDS